MASSKRHAMTRSMITEASASVFAKKGFHGATMDEIAKEAGYSPAGLYKYFRSKEEIFGELLRLLLQASLEQVESMMPDSLSFELRLRLLLSRMAQFGVKHRELFRASLLTLHCPVEVEPGLRGEFLENHRTYVEALRSFIQQGIDSGELRSVDALDAATALIGLLHAFGARW
ncbi:MAG: TetR/AcrR family transcriptional regulator, partial [Myxococcota bacterium]|nr:TetR/AcrR family transcriptional regulator [Myxococcota bacterium]